MGTKKGLVSNSPYYVWQGIVHGTRWRAVAVCMGCAMSLAGLPAEAPEVPGDDLPDWAEDMLLDHGYIEDADKPSSLRILDIITNVPTKDKPLVEADLVASTGCFIPGHDTVKVFWRRV